MQGLGLVTNADLLATGQRPLMKLWINVGGPIDITILPDPVTGVPKNYLKDISFTSGGARMTPHPIAGQFSAIISNEGNIFHPNHPTSGYQTYFQAGRQVWIELGGNYAVGGIKYWQRIIGYMDEPEFSSDTFELTIKGLDYMSHLSDIKFNKEILCSTALCSYTPIDNYWGDVKIHSTVSTTGGLLAELYKNGDSMQFVTAPGVPPGETINLPGWVWSPGGFIAMAGVGDVTGGSVFIGNVGFLNFADQWIRNLSVCTPANLVQGTQYRFDFKYKQVAGSEGATFKLYQPPDGTCDGGSKLVEPTDNNWHSDYIIFTAIANAPLAMQVTFHDIVGQWNFDQFQIREITPAPWHKYDMSLLGCTGIYYVELDEGGGAGFQPVWPGKQGSPGEGWYYDDSPGNEQFYFDEEKVVPTAAANLRIYYFTAQAPEDVLADILVKAGYYGTRLLALAAMAVIPTGVSVDRVWFNAGSTYIKAIKMLCERCNYRFYFNWNGDPKFVTAPTVGVQQFTTFLPQHFTSPKLYQNTNEIRNKIVIEGEKRAELTGWEENMPSELKDEVSDAPSIVAYGEHTLNIRNHLFQDQISISAMCGTLLVAYRIPKWYFDFETPYNAVPLELGDTVWVQELLDIALPITVTHICLIRNADIALYNVTYKCEMEGGGMIELLASIDDIDLNALGETPLYTVPAGRGCIITQVIMRNADGAVVNTLESFGWNSGDADDVIADVNRTLAGATNYEIIPAKSEAIRGVAGGIFKIDVNTAEGGARTCTVDVFGYLYWP